MLAAYLNLEVANNCCRYRKTLDKWVTGKLQSWDSDPKFQKERAAQGYSTREAYAVFLKEKSDEMYKKQVGGKK